MARSKIDLDALRKFRLRLRDIRDEIQQEQRKLAKTVKDAGTFWKEDAYKIFEARHSAAELALTTFIRQCDDQLDWIEEKERRGREFLDY